MSDRQRAKMDPTVFGLALSRIKPTARGSGKSYEGARLVMVEGRRISEAERLANVSRQGIYKAMKRLQEEFTNLGICSSCGQRLPRV